MGSRCQLTSTTYNCYMQKTGEVEHPSWNHHFTRCSVVTRVATRHTTFGWDHIGSLSVCTSCWWLRGKNFLQWSKIFVLLQPFSKVKKISIHTHSKTTNAPVNVFIPFEVRDLSPRNPHMAIVASRQHTLREIFHLNFFTYHEIWLQDWLPAFFSAEKTPTFSPTPTHPLFLLRCKREWIR